MQIADTAPEALEVQFEVFRRMTPDERFEVGMEMIEFVYQTVLDGIRQRNPEFSPDEVVSEYMRITYRDLPVAQAND